MNDVVWLPLVTFVIGALPRHRPLRVFIHLTSALGVVIGTAYFMPSLDKLSAMFALLVSSLCALVVLFATGIFPRTTQPAGPLWSRRAAFFMLLGAFWTSMLVAVTAHDFIVLWIGISATTLATTFLVAYIGGRTALEAAWKYLILCSFGIAVALVGIFFLGRAAADLGLPMDRALDWSMLAVNGGALGTPLARVGLLLMLAGFATKAGLVPMHAWLPDAHSKAPSSVSALLSGLLVSCALYAIARVQFVAHATPDAALFNNVLLGGGALSVMVASLLMLAQRDLKRLLAYSTVEHAGIVAVGLGIGTPLAAIGALYHVLNHAFCKSLAFLSAGAIADEYGTTSLGALHALAKRFAGKTLLASLVGLAGLPPFGLLFSEIILCVAAVQTHAWAALACVVIGSLLAFAALLRVAVETGSGRLLPETVSFLRSRLRPFAAVALATILFGAFFLTLLPFLPIANQLLAIVDSLMGGS